MRSTFMITGQYWRNGVDMKGQWASFGFMYAVFRCQTQSAGTASSCILHIFLHHRLDLVDRVVASRVRVTDPVSTRGRAAELVDPGVPDDHNLLGDELTPDIA